MSGSPIARGGNVVLGPASADGLCSVVVDLSWSADFTVDCATLVCTKDRTVIGDEYFVFYNQPISPERAVWVRAEPGHAQVLVDLSSLASEANRLVVALATVEEGRNLSGVSALTARAFDPTTGEDLVLYEVDGVTRESCLVVAEVYRHTPWQQQPTWKFRAIGQGYENGLIGLGADYGVALA